MLAAPGPSFLSGAGEATTTEPSPLHDGDTHERELSRETSRPSTSIDFPCIEFRSTPAASASPFPHVTT
jgi:hypothetical protein